MDLEEKSLEQIGDRCEECGAKLTKAEIEALSAQAGLAIIRRVLEEEIAQHCGSHGRQSAYRHGHQPGYVVYAGRKVPIPKPRVRQKGAGEIVLRSYEAFQQDGRLQRAVARQLSAPGEGVARPDRWRGWAWPWRQGRHRLLPDR